MIKPRIYVAGPITGSGTIEGNQEIAIAAAELLWLAGWVPFIPHLTAAWHSRYPKSWEDWMAWDEEWLRLCDAIVRFPGKSRGADSEVRLASRLNKLVFSSVDHAIEWIETATHIVRPEGPYRVERSFRIKPHVGPG